MRVLIQRVREASVTIDEKLYSQIDRGLLLLVGIEQEDNEEDIDWLVHKICQLRIFEDSEQKMNLSLLDIGAEVMVVSQFTLFASTKKGNRPGFSRAASPQVAESRYLQFVDAMNKSANNQVKTGKFAANMDIALINEGPVTILMDSKNKE
jgi:D-aminoacyl-tRNA deacylase